VPVVVSKNLAPVVAVVAVASVVAASEPPTVSGAVKELGPASLA